MNTKTFIKTAMVFTMSLATLLPTAASAQTKTVKPQATIESRVTYTSPAQDSTSSINSIDINFKFVTNNPNFENKRLQIGFEVSNSSDITNPNTASEMLHDQKVIFDYGSLGSEENLTITDVPLLYSDANYISCMVKTEGSIEWSNICGINEEIVANDQYDMLKVNYGGNLLPVYRFWSPVLKSHFYTNSASEKKYVENTYAPSGTWTYERIAYYSMPYSETVCPGSSSEVHRFWSPTLGRHFYTASESEKDYVIATYPGVWNYERIAFCANEFEQEGTKPVYRFWSPTLKSHFYTISESEKDYVIATYPGVWNYERIAYYAFEKAGDTPVGPRQ